MGQEEFRAEEYRKGIAKWLEGFEWQWFCSLTFYSGVTPAQAYWRLRRWMEVLGEALGDPNFGYVAVCELGRTRENLHYHALVMGLTDHFAEQRLYFMERWNRLCGDARVEPFIPGPQGIEYILKDISPDNPDAIIWGIKAGTHMQTELEAK
jgi:hypothetical protein